jgi:hypothetical protein
MIEVFAAGVLVWLCIGPAAPIVLAAPSAVVYFVRALLRSGGD